MKLYSTLQAAEYLGCSKMTVIRHVSKGTLRTAHDNGGTSFIFAQSELDRFKRENSLKKGRQPAK